MNASPPPVGEWEAQVCESVQLHQKRKTLALMGINIMGVSHSSAAHETTSEQCGKYELKPCDG